MYSVHKNVNRRTIVAIKSTVRISISSLLETEPHFHIGPFRSWIFFSMEQQPQWLRAFSLSRLHDHTQTHHIRYDSSGRVINLLQKTAPDNWARHWHKTHKRQTSTPSAGFEPAIPASEPPQTHALDRASTEFGLLADVCISSLPEVEKNILASYGFWFLGQIGEPTDNWIIGK
jgi:hypothetical protein